MMVWCEHARKGSGKWRERKRSACRMFAAGKLSSVSVERRAESGEQTLESGDLTFFEMILTKKMPITVKM